MVILGIDPGTATVGYGLIKKTGRDVAAIDYGCIETSSTLSPGERLKIIHESISKIIEKHSPKLMAVENVYFFKNLKTAMPVSQAKGVILFTAANASIPVFEFTPLQMKMAITGYGKAEKKQVQKMIKIMLGLEEKPLKKDRRKDDATDALGIALCCAIKNNFL
ncbi:MAG: crossover junction endodeoxyribonuclease RuvC [Candidatus Nealsonbacteria bacterium RIFOXYB1_FULL_40_15]|uniref:Crossover junction endodeoxyribonuclease RuvC n=2 Tax=Candidatus Nealsoniibacteriota TaxID=1817911 RepID=A0A1G2ESD4_9BACT|nr:MAG: crossover junction endodeoxyribonuclease RuvC [Candidatus Nealsonbacteria bacterium RIFOXYB1_FULL_40_15]OGZ28724.1 MAG: crossover junction endodeoxyribonuclease RuvC [Candidatus Nealsonbacteria bacterium RIFOXYC1_FULL_40_7]OGZ29722.1 MAG: crossover junction endodeoxyribonuclease RuvC [Candidatus Nealsonbacteria bacterium RIFOXYD1_FULL_39_11]